MARTAPSQQKATAISCLKRLQPRGAELSGEPLSATEETLLQRFDALRTEVRGEERLKGFIGGAPFRARPGAAQIRRRLVKQLKDELPDALGEPEGRYPRPHPVGVPPRSEGPPCEDHMRR